MEYSLEAEYGVLGGLLQIGDLSCEAAEKVFSMLKPSSFQLRAHQVIYEVIRSAGNEADYVDAILIDAIIERKGLKESTGGYNYLIELIGKAKVASLVAHADLVRQSAIERVVNSKLQNAIATLNDKDGRTVYEKLGELESTISALCSRSVQNRTSGLKHIEEIAERWSHNLEQRFDNPEAVRGYMTGIESLDNMLAPKQVPKGSLFVIGARPKMGKTALLNMIVKQFALNTDKAAAVFSLEMPEEQIFERMLVERARVDPKILYVGADDQSDFARVHAAVGEYINSSLYVDDTAGITLNHIQREVRALAKKKPIGIIAVDYLTLMEEEKADRNDLAYGKITKGLKKLAKELDCVVLLLTQLNRGLESRTNKRPMPSDSRDTGQIEQDCDFWVGLYRHAVYDELVRPEDKGLTELIVRYNRHGDTGTCHLNLKQGYFEEAAPFSFDSAIGNDDY